LLVCGVIWTGFCLLVLSKWILPRAYWFELGLINYGMSTGTTATGFVLLRVIDPELESGAAEDYALAAPLSSPFIGGGILTIALPLLVFERVPIAVPTIAMIAVVTALVFVGKRWNRLAESSTGQSSRVA
jgi:ESS family glutamate:Na+ symporter